MLVNPSFNFTGKELWRVAQGYWPYATRKQLKKFLNRKGIKHRAERKYILGVITTIRITSYQKRQQREDLKNRMADRIDPLLLFGGSVGRLEVWRQLKSLKDHKQSSN